MVKSVLKIKFKLVVFYYGILDKQKKKTVKVVSLNLLFYSRKFKNSKLIIQLFLNYEWLI